MNKMRSNLLNIAVYSVVLFGAGKYGYDIYKGYSVSKSDPAVWEVRGLEQSKKYPWYSLPVPSYGDSNYAHKLDSVSVALQRNIDSIVNSFDESQQDIKSKGDYHYEEAETTDVYILLSGLASLVLMSVLKGEADSKKKKAERQRQMKEQNKNRWSNYNSSGYEQDKE